ncbi:MAG: hypothetical protein CL764_04295 [Chloroflexi bacterium]|nr:hypothetical protein [Chloroflexota bacterium]|tara:strand:+ start:82 stop:873 length:792 start_codon:yes stop_codon:yes gene_type:complete
MRTQKINSFLKNFHVMILIFLIFGCQSAIQYYDSEPACKVFFELTEGVLKDEMPINEIKIKIRELEITSMKSSDEILVTSSRFIRAAEEAVANYYDYPTFMPLAYDDTYEHMEIHVESYLALKELTEACEKEGFPSKTKEIIKSETEVKNSESVNQENILRENSKIPSIDSANNELMKFLKSKTWGFFGGTCDQWVNMDYDFKKQKSYFINESNDWKIVWDLKPDKFLGPKTLIYYINAETGSVSGDTNNKQNSPISEGCDKW